MEDIAFFKPRAVRRERKDIKEEHVEEEGTTNLKQYIEDRYRFDEEEFGKKKREQQLKFYVLEYLKRTKRMKFSMLPDNLSHDQFGSIIFCIQSELCDLANFIDMFLRYGGCQVLFGYMLVSIFIAIPFYMIFFFMGYYSKQKYFKVWSSVPILKGLSYTLCANAFISIIMNISMCVIGTYMAYISIGNPNRLKCDYVGSDENCVKIQDTFNVTCDEENGKYLQFSTLSYLESMITDKNDSFVINWGWITTCPFIWLLMLAMIIFSKFFFPTMCTVALVLWSLVLIPSIIIGVVLGSTYTVLPPWEGEFNTLLTIEFWTRVMILALRSVFPGDLITYSSMCKADKLSTTEAYFAIFAKILVILVFSNLTGISINILAENYAISDYRCLRLNGLTVLYAVIPDSLLRIPGSSLLLAIYFAILSLLVFSSVYFTLNSMLESLYDNAPKMLQFKKSLVIIVVTASFLGVCLILNNKYLTIYLLRVQLVMPNLIIIFFMAVFIILYSPTRILNDFHFTYGYSLSEYWRNTMKFVVIFIMCTIVGYVLFCFIYMEKMKVYFNLVGGVIMLFPIICMGVTNYMNYKNGIKGHLLKPEAKWGPPSRQARIDRRKFNPKRECRFMGRFVCNHECLLDCPHLEEEMQYWQDRQTYFYKKYHLKKGEAAGAGVFIGESTSTQGTNGELPGRHSAEAALWRSMSKINQPRKSKFA